MTSLRCVFSEVISPLLVERPFVHYGFSELSFRKDIKRIREGLLELDSSKFKNCDEMDVALLRDMLNDDRFEVLYLPSILMYYLLGEVEPSPEEHLLTSLEYQEVNAGKALYIFDQMISYAQIQGYKRMSFWKFMETPSIHYSRIIDRKSVRLDLMLDPGRILLLREAYDTLPPSLNPVLKKKVFTIIRETVCPGFTLINAHKARNEYVCYALSKSLDYDELVEYIHCCITYKWAALGRLANVITEKIMRPGELVSLFINNTNLKALEILRTKIGEAVPQMMYHYKSIQGPPEELLDSVSSRLEIDVTEIRDEFEYIDTLVSTEEIVARIPKAVVWRSTLDELKDFILSLITVNLPSIRLHEKLPFDNPRWSWLISSQFNMVVRRLYAIFNE